MNAFEAHDFRVRVYFEDTDAQGVVYFANYLKFMERGRTECLRAIGVEQDWLMAEHGLCFALTEQQAKFLKPARFNDEVIVRTQIKTVGKARIALSQAVLRENDGTVLCSADCVAACIDAESFKPRRIPVGLFQAPE